MSGMVFYATHPQIQMYPAVPVPKWSLSVTGRERAVRAAGKPWARNLSRIISSAETKAIETAALFAEVRNLVPEIREAMHENDRSATGFLPPDEFEQVADAFFAHPHESIRGWEPAAAAQARIVTEVTAALARPHDGGDILIVGHGAVGTLLMTHLLGLTISRRHDQPAGGGNVFAFDLAERVVQHRWKRWEDMPG